MSKKKLPFFAIQQQDKEIPLRAGKHLRKIDGTEAIILYLKNINRRASREEIADYFGLSLRQIQRYFSNIVPYLLEMIGEK